jgi:hypothetical protein
MLAVQQATLHLPDGLRPATRARTAAGALRAYWERAIPHVRNFGVERRVHHPYVCVG